MSLLWSTVREKVSARGFSVNMGMQGVHVSAEQNCLDGVYTVRSQR